MKKTSLLIITITIVLTLCGCGRVTEYVSQVHELVSSGEEEKRAADPVDFSEEETASMLNFMLFNRYTSDGTRIYGTVHSNSSEYPSLYSMSQKMKKMDLLDSGADAQFLVLEGDWLYYLRTDIDTNASTICRVKKDASSKPETLYSQDCFYLQLFNSRLYFTDAAGRLLSMNTDGSDIKTEYSEYQVCYPYLSGSWLFFQNGSDNENLWAYSFAAKESGKIADGPVYTYLISGNSVSFGLGEYEYEPGDSIAYQYVGEDFVAIFRYDEQGYDIEDSIQYPGETESVIIPRTD